MDELLQINTKEVYLLVYEAFLMKVKDEAQKALGSGYALTLRRIPKNNGMVMDGLCIAKNNSRIAPALYLNPFYEQYLRGRPVREITDEILRLYHSNQPPRELDCRLFEDFNAVQSKIACRLIHCASNQELLSQIPFIPWEDLALVFYLCIQEDERGLMTAMIYNQHLTAWKLSLEQLKTIAMKNTPQLFPPVISSISCILEELSREFSFSCDLPLYPPDSPPFYVLTNSCGINGAVCMLYPQVLKNFAEGMEHDILILPSSIHEVLLLPDENDVPYENLINLVTSINQSEVPSHERLSNQVYRFSRSTNTLQAVSDCHLPVC